MRRSEVMRRFFLISLAIALLPQPSCSSRPGVQELELPILGSVLAGQLINPEQLTPSTRAYLEEKKLLRQFRRDPAAVAIALREELETDPSPEARIVLAEVCSDTGERLAALEPYEAVGYHLAAAGAALPGALDTDNPAFQSDLQEAYNSSCRRVARILFDSKHNWSETVTIDGPGRQYRLTCLTNGGAFVDPGQFDRLWAAERLKFNRLDDFKRIVRPGFGGALVGHRKWTEERAVREPMLPPFGLSRPLCATLDSNGDNTNVDLAFHEVMVADTTRLRDRQVTLRADLTAPLATLYNYTPKKDIGWAGLRHPERYAKRTGLFQFEPYREDQIPIILVHGLASSPATWFRALNLLRADPVLRKRFQLLAFYYPTGFPISYNAAGLRVRLKAFREFYDPQGTNPNMRNMMLVGHSMGGILSNTQIRSSGDTMASKFFTKPIDDIDGFSPEQKEALKSLLIYEANPNITRAVFVAAPHRGSDLAMNTIGGIVTGLIQVPFEIISVLPLRDVDGLTEHGQDIVNRQRITSIDNLRPDSPSLASILEQKVRPGVNYHSVIGRRDLEGPLEGTTDGVVPYTSAHLDGPDSEKVVHATHTSITADAAAVEEVRRILYQHLGLSPPVTPLVDLIPAE